MLPSIGCHKFQLCYRFNLFKRHGFDMNNCIFYVFSLLITFLMAFLRTQKPKKLLMIYFSKNLGYFLLVIFRVKLIIGRRCH